MTETCAICRADLSGASTYTLPECGHTFHAECAINWFRSPRDPYIAPRHNIDQGIPGTCPLCRAPPASKFHFCTRRGRVNILRKLSRKKNTPEIITKAFKREARAKKRERDAISALRDFRKKNKDILKRERQLRQMVWKANQRINDIHDQIAAFDPHILVDDIYVFFN